MSYKDTPQEDWTQQDWRDYYNDASVPTSVFELAFSTDADGNTSGTVNVYLEPGYPIPGLGYDANVFDLDSMEAFASPDGTTLEGISYNISTSVDIGSGYVPFAVYGAGISTLTFGPPPEHNAPPGGDVTVRSLIPPMPSPYSNEYDEWVAKYLYVPEEPEDPPESVLSALTGTVKDQNGNPVYVQVLCRDRETDALVGETWTEAETGIYSVPCYTGKEHYIIVVLPDGREVVVQDRVVLDISYRFEYLTLDVVDNALPIPLGLEKGGTLAGTTNWICHYYQSPDGTQVWGLSRKADYIVEWRLTTPYDWRTAYLYQTVNITWNHDSESPYYNIWRAAMCFTHAGTKLWIWSGYDKDVFQLNCATPYDVNTATFDSSNYTYNDTHYYNYEVRQFEWTADGTGYLSCTRVGTYRGNINQYRYPGHTYTLQSRYTDFEFDGIPKASSYVDFFSYIFNQDGTDIYVNEDGSTIYCYPAIGFKLPDQTYEEDLKYYASMGVNCRLWQMFWSGDGKVFTAPKLNSYEEGDGRFNRALVKEPFTFDFGPNGETNLEWLEFKNIAPRWATNATSHISPGYICFTFSPDGKRFTAIDGALNSITWNVGTPFDISTLKQEGIKFVDDGFDYAMYYWPDDYYWRPDGTQMYWADGGGWLFWANLLIPWDLTSVDTEDTFDDPLAYNGIGSVRLDYNTSGQIHHLRGIYNINFTPDGMTAIIGANDGSLVNVYLSAPWTFECKGPWPEYYDGDRYIYWLRRYYYKTTENIGMEHIYEYDDRYASMYWQSLQFSDDGLRLIQNENGDTDIYVHYFSAPYDIMSYTHSEYISSNNELNINEFSMGYMKILPGGMKIVTSYDSGLYELNVIPS